VGRVDQRGTERPHGGVQAHGVTGDMISARRHRGTIVAGRSLHWTKGWAKL